jgi:hypothetical protein
MKQQMAVLVCRLRFCCAPRPDEHNLCKELHDKQIAKTMQQNAALTWLDGAPATMATPV